MSDYRRGHGTWVSKCPMCSPYDLVVSRVVAVTTVQLGRLQLCSRAKLGRGVEFGGRAELGGV